MKRPTPSKSRKAADRPRVLVREACDHDDPRNSHAPNHVAGIFEDAGYGMFGFGQHLVTMHHNTDNPVAERASDSIPAAIRRLAR